MSRLLLEHQTTNITGDWFKPSHNEDYHVAAVGTFDGATVKVEKAVVDDAGTYLITAQDPNLTFTAVSDITPFKFPREVAVRAVVENAGVSTDVTLFLGK